MRSLIQRGRRRRGNVILESALVLWPFVLLLLGIVQIGFVVWSNSTLKYAVDSAVRHAALSGARSTSPASQQDLEQYLRDHALGLQQDLLTVQVIWTPNNRPGSTVRIEANYAIPTLVNIVWTNPFPLKATSQMLIVN